MIFLLFMMEILFNGLFGHDFGLIIPISPTGVDGTCEYILAF